MKKHTNQIPYKFLLIAGILILAFLFRFYNLGSWLTFGMDQEYEALIVKNIVTGKHFPLIGVNASDTGLYLGPAFIYFATLPFILFNGNPVGFGITASIIGILTVYLVYRIGKEMFSDRVGIFASLLYAGSFLTSFYDRRFWNPTPVPLFSLLIGLFLYRILQGKAKTLIPLAVFFALSFHIHLSLLIFTPLITYVIWIKRKTFPRRLIILSLIIFFLIQTPVIFFESRHNFLNTEAAIKLISNKNKEGVFTVVERGNLLLSTLGRYFWLPSQADLSLETGQCKELSAFRKNAYPEGMLLVLVGLLTFGWWSFRANEGKKSDAAKIIIGIFLPTFLFVLFYRREVFEYYFLYLFPWIALSLGKSLSFIWDKKHGNLIVVPTVSLFVILNLISLFSANSSYSYHDKLEAINFVEQNIDNKSYSLEALGECPRFEGYRYLFEYYVKTPIKSYMDSYFGWLYPDSIKYSKPQRVILLSLIDSRYKSELIRKWEEAKLDFLSEYNVVAEKSFNNIRVFILLSKYGET